MLLWLRLQAGLWIGEAGLGIGAETADRKGASREGAVMG